MEKKPGLFWCTCAEVNQDQYAERVLRWFRRYGEYKDVFDFAVLCDGHLA